MKLYTDGACEPNPGRGGWAYRLLSDGGDLLWEDCGMVPITTNNRMELQAVIEGLRSLSRPTTLAVYSDSRYVIDGITKWVRGWQKRNWMTVAKVPVLNLDLWRELVALRDQHQVSWHWTRGHVGDLDNELCDRSAVSALRLIR